MGGWVPGVRDGFPMRNIPMIPSTCTVLVERRAYFSQGKKIGIPAKSTRLYRVAHDSSLLTITAMTLPAFAAEIDRAA